MNESEISSNLAILKKQAILKDFSDSELKQIAKLVKRMEFQVNDIILNEEELSTELYFLIEGEVDVIKMDDKKNFNIKLNRLYPGDLIGEMSFADSSPRSSTIEASKKTIVLQLSRQDVENCGDSKLLPKLLVNIGKINMDRLRSSNVQQTKLLTTSFRKFQIQHTWGSFILMLLLAFGFMNLLFYFLGTHYQSFSSHLFTWSYWWLLLIPVVTLIKKYHIYLDELGLKTKNTITHFYQTGAILVAGIPILFITYLIARPKNATLSMPLGLWLVCYFFYVCVYEFISRGLIFCGIKKFWEDEKGWFSIFITACFLTFIPLTSLIQAGNNIVLLFLMNILLGAIFLIQGQLAGVIIIHFLLGIYANYLTTFIT